MPIEAFKKSALGLNRSEAGPLGKDNLLSLLELGLDPLALVLSLWVTAYFFEERD